MKSLYYCRSLSIQRADAVSEKAVRPAEFTGIPMAYDGTVNDPHHAALPLVEAANRATPIDYEECLSCQ
jgi:ribonucleoside-diphosphate reductase alpha chain